MERLAAALVLVGGMQRINAVPEALTGMGAAEVRSGAALTQRIEWALLALCSGV